LMGGYTLVFLGWPGMTHSLQNLHSGELLRLAVHWKPLAATSGPTKTIRVRTHRTVGHQMHPKGSCGGAFRALNGLAPQPWRPPPSWRVGIPTDTRRHPKPVLYVHVDCRLSSISAHPSNNVVSTTPYSGSSALAYEPLKCRE
jgi:hypothetical protein